MEQDNCCKKNVENPTQTHTHTNQHDSEEMIKSSIKLNECEGAQLFGPRWDDAGTKQDAIH